MTTRPTLDALAAALPAEARALLDAVSAAADAHGVELWAVGGVPRDLAAGRPPGDVDCAVVSPDPAAAERIARAAAARLGGGCEVAPEPRFGAASLRRGAHRLELTATRTERYARPGALPEVCLGAPIEADLPRRDFTVNATALGIAGPRRDEWLDPFGGLGDLAARRLRALHARSFADDATRLWRGARHAAALDLRPEPATARRIAEGARWAGAPAPARLWAEFERTASTRRVGRAIGLLDRWGVLRGVHDGWTLPDAAARALRHRPGPHAPAVLLAVLLAPLAGREAIAARVGAPRAPRDAASDAARLLALPDASPDALAGVEGVDDHARLAARWLDPERQPALQRALRRWGRTRSPLDGHALRRLGVPEGPAIGAWLDRLRRARHLGTLDAAAARRLVRGELARGAQRIEGA